MEKLSSRLKKALKWKIPEGQKVQKSVTERAHYFFVIAQYRVLMQLEQVISISEKSALFNSLIV